MSKQLEISDELSLPIDAATQTFAFIARKGGGKTYAAGKLTELLLDAGVQCVVLDTVGNWYGLRLAADGKSPGFDIPVLGGLRGDIPLEATGGELVADLVVDSGRSVIIDVSQFSLEDRKRFATAFGIRLWARKKGEASPSPLHLVMEESQLIIPQKVDGSNARMVGIYEEIVRLGRNYGIGVSMISQRPQSVNKEVLNQTECLVALQVNGAQERKALKEWVVHQGLSVDLLNELPSLPIGTGYFWSPQWLGILKKVKIGTKKTFDASATPKVGEKRSRRELAPLDLEAFRTKMAATIERAKENDPSELKREIAKLKKEVAAKQPAQKVEEKRVEVPVLKADERKNLHSISRSLDKLCDQNEKVMGVAHDSRTLIATLVARIDERLKLPVPKIPAPRPAPIHREVQHHYPAAPVRTFSPRPESNGELNGSQQQILNTVAMLRTRGIRPTLEVIAAWVDLHPNGGRYRGNLRYLHENGFLSDHDLTPKGEAQARALPTGLDAIANVLNGGESSIFEQLRNGEVFTVETLAEALSLHPNGGRFRGNLRRLRTMAVVSNGTEIKLTEAAYS